MIATQTKRIIKREKIFAKRKFGQNFLIDVGVLNKIIKTARVSDADTIIEIGPGIGALTEALALSAKQVVAYEIDKKMVDVLQDNLKNKKNIEIINQDIMTADLSIYEKDVKIVANLPYNIATAVIFKILRETKIKDMCFMIQKEVAEKLTAKCGEKKYGYASCLMQYLSDASLEFIVAPKSFYPAPVVESAFLKIKRKDMTICDKFIDFMKVAFSYKRKTLINNLLKGYEFSKEELNNTFALNAIPANIRAESMTPHLLLRLFDILFGAGK